MFFLECLVFTWVQLGYFGLGWGAGVCIQESLESSPSLPLFIYWWHSSPSEKWPVILTLSTTIHLHVFNNRANPNHRRLPAKNSQETMLNENWPIFKHIFASLLVISLREYWKFFCKWYLETNILNWNKEGGYMADGRQAEWVSQRNFWKIKEAKGEKWGLEIDTICFSVVLNTLCIRVRYLQIPLSALSSKLNKAV